MKHPLDPAQHATPLKFFLRVNGKEIPWIVLNSILYGAGATAMIFVSYVVGRVIDRLNAGMPVTSLLWGIIGVVICYEVSYRLGHICEIHVKTRIRARTKKTLFDHTRSLSFGYFADRFAGETAHKIAVCADAYERLTLIVTNNLIEEIILISLSAVVLGSSHFLYAGLLIVWSVMLLSGIIILTRQTDTRAAAWSLQETRTTGALVDVYANIGAVKVYGKYEHANTVHQQIDTETKALLRLGKWDVLLFHFQGLSIILLVIGLIGISSFLYKHALIGVGTIVTVAAIGFRLYGSVWELGPRLAEFIRFRGEIRQNLRDLVVAPAIVDGDHATSEKHEDLSVEYCDVVFGYNDKQLILNNFSLLVKPKERVGIVGLSGAGKTTFAHLLLRFFDVTQGEISINGSDIRNFTQEFLRSHISYISQDTSLFHASIAENIAYGAPAASQSDIEAAARLAYADEFIRELPQAYESIVGERGIKLSGGQRQRIAIARALLADRSLFLLDEATSALDSESEEKIQKGLLTLMENKTVIAIAHRLSTLSQMERIIFLEAGQIVEQGSPEELLALNGKYAALWRLQAGGFLPD